MRLNETDLELFKDTMTKLVNMGVKDEQEAIVILQKEVNEYKARIEAFQEYISDHQQDFRTVTKTAIDGETTVTIRSKKQVTSIGVYFADEGEGVF